MKKFLQYIGLKSGKTMKDQALVELLLSIVMRSIKENDYPVFLHTQPSRLFVQ